MSATKHTPGPWYTEQIIYDNSPVLIVRAPFYSEAVHCRKPKAGHTAAERKQQNADARLISAAPSMYQRLVDEIGKEEADNIVGW